MNPDDDPEKRIRDLERPLSDAARTSELGTTPTAPPPGGWLPPPAPPQGYYGPPTPPVPPPSSSPGMRVGWIVLGLMVIGVLVGGGVIVATNLFSTTRSMTSTPTTPGVSGGGGPFTPTSRPTNPGVTAAPSPPSTPAATVDIPPPGGNISVAGIDENKTIACNESAVSVSGVGNTVVITGHCTRLEVSGMDNNVIVDAADSISASGMDNKVTFHSGSPTIDKSGFSNTVEQG